jgi:proline iminopeptidase
MAKDGLIFGLSPAIYADFARVFSHYPQIRQVLIFGSRAKGTAKPYSDIDLAVIAPSLSAREFALLWHELNELPIVFKLDVLHWDTIAKPELKEKVMAQGQFFYPPSIPLPSSTGTP